jgi:ligand-binding SRPBCC domain-containing protein
MRYERAIEIAAPVEEVFRFHEDTGNLSRITPPSVKVEIVEVRGTYREGCLVRLRSTQFGFLRQEFLMEFVEYDAPRKLVDEQREGPFVYWRQTRIFTPIPGGTRLTDIVDYGVPFGILGRIANALVIAPRIRSMFEYRQRRTKEMLERAPDQFP